MAATALGRDLRGLGGSADNFGNDLASAARGELGPEARQMAEAFITNSQILLKLSSRRLALSIIGDQAAVLSATLRSARDSSQVAADVGKFSTESTTAITSIKNVQPQDAKAALNTRASQIRTGTMSADESMQRALLERTQSRWGTMLSGLTLGGAFLGLTITGMMLYGFAAADDTDGVTIPINNITIIDSTHVQVDYNPPYNQHPAFSIAVGDALDFSCAVAACMVPASGSSLSGVRVSELKGDSSCVVELALQSAGGRGINSPASSGGPGSPGVASGQAYWGQATVHTSVENQFLSAFSSVAGGAAAMLNTVTNTVLGPGGIVPTIVDDAAGAAHNAFCDIVPFMCSGNLLWIILGFIGFIILCVVGYFLLKSMGESKGGASNGASSGK